jgi:hypothetical protein
VELVERTPCPLLGYGNESVARALRFRDMVSIVLGAFPLKCDITQHD